jgi:hypothetical protein
VKLDPAQHAVLARLAQALPSSYYLAGGVGVAFHLAHRASKDLDLFTTSDPNQVLPALERMSGVTVMNTATGTVHLVMDGVPVSLLEYRYPPLRRPSASRVCQCRWRPSSTCPV